MWVANVIDACLCERSMQAPAQEVGSGWRARPSSWTLQSCRRPPWTRSKSPEDPAPVQCLRAATRAQQSA